MVQRRPRESCHVGLLRRASRQELLLSFGEGASHVHELATRAAAYGQAALALTDTNLCGALEFANLAGTLGLKPITGGETHALGRLAHNAAVEVQGRVLQPLPTISPLANSEATGVSRGSMSEHLPDHAQGLIMLTGGRDGRLSRLLVEGRYGEARKCLEAG